MLTDPLIVPREDGGHPPPRSDWRQVVRNDLQTEQPKWPFTCYAHERDGPNDLDGDVSFEEVRWANQQAVVQGANPATLMTPFEKAAAHRQQQIQVNPPSEGESREDNSIGVALGSREVRGH